MATPRRRPGIERALDTIDSVCRKLRMDRRSRLPSVLSLASRARVASRTMHQALRLRCSSGHLRSRPGSGFFICDTPARPPSGQPRHRLSTPARPWQRAAEYIRDRIRTGSWAPRSLIPSSKDLQTQTGICSRTLRKALLALENQRWLKRRGWRYEVLAAHASRRSRVMLILAGHSIGRPYSFSPRNKSNLHAIQSECLSRNLLLEIFVCDLRGGVFREGRPVDIARVAADDDVLGVLLWATTILTPQFTSLLDTLVSIRQHVSVLDEGSGFEYGEHLRRSPRLHVFHTSDFDAGVRVGRYLLSNGHRAIAFLSPFGGHAWSRDRFLGVESAVRECCDAEVVDYACSAEDDIHQAARGGVYEQLLSRISEETRGTVMTDTSYALLMEVRAQIEYATEQLSMPEALEKACMSALAERRLTAWVCANDVTALKCLSLLGKHRIKVPATISVVGFDDSLESLYSNLTTYSFNAPAIMSAMVHALTGPHRSPRPASGLHTVEGLIVERSTTRHQGTVRNP